MAQIEQTDFVSQAAQMVLHALLYFGTLTALVVMFWIVIAAIWWLLKGGLWRLGRFIRSITEE